MHNMTFNQETPLRFCCLFLIIPILILRLKIFPTRYHLHTVLLFIAIQIELQYNVE